MKKSQLPHGISLLEQLKGTTKQPLFLMPNVKKLIGKVLHTLGIRYPKRPSYTQDTITIRFFVDQNTGDVSIMDSGVDDKVGLYLCLPIFSTKARILLGRQKLAPSEVEQYVKIRHDV